MNNKTDVLPEGGTFFCEWWTVDRQYDQRYSGTNSFCKCRWL